MNKKIPFFNIWQKITLILGIFLLCVVLIISAIIVLTPDYKENKITYLENVEIYKKEDVEDINFYNKNNTIHIYVKFKAKQKDTYLLNYSYYYYEKFKMCLYLTIDNVEYIKLITINENAIAAIV